MKVREQLERQLTINNYNSFLWVVVFSLSVVILVFANALPWTWLAALICVPAWFVSQKALHAKCPFCHKIPLSIVHGIIGNFCENCGESFDRELTEKADGIKCVSEPNA